MLLKNFLCFSSNNKYTLDCHFSGHNDAILCLAVSDSGKTLASGGCDGLRLWDLEKKIELRRPSQTRNPQDPITCITWLTPKDDNKEFLCSGTGLGHLFLWKKCGYEFEEILARRIGMGQEVMAISCDTSEVGMRVYTVTRDKRVQAWTLDSRYNLSSIFSVELQATVPRAVYSHGADVIVFGMYNGETHTLRGKDGMVLATKSTGRLMGGVAVDPTHTFFVIDNAANGFSLHRMDDAVALAEEATMVVGGGEDGWVHVFDRTTGQVSQTLQHSKSGRVQTVTHPFDSGGYIKQRNRNLDFYMEKGSPHTTQTREARGIEALVRSATSPANSRAACDRSDGCTSSHANNARGHINTHQTLWKGVKDRVCKDGRHVWQHAKEVVPGAAHPSAK
ncbi:WD40-repeat-containing domain protein [Pisolithus croceorrhizus]|nr:WD40-repeat-containing domain protein [Pisolithus croceorrhizus]